MNNIFSFCNQKGGVGKTTSAINIATILSMRGYRSLVVDMDAQANATSGFGVEKDKIFSTSYQLLVENSNPELAIHKTDISNLDIIPSSYDLSGADMEMFGMERREFILKEQLNKISARYQFIFLDCPPSLGLVTVNCLTASRYVMIPLQCEYYALEGLGHLLSTYQLVKKKLNPDLDIGCVMLTMADFRTNLTQQVIEEVRNYFKEKVFRTVIPRSVRLSEAPSFGKPAVIYDTHNKGSQSYVAMAQEFLDRFDVKTESAAVNSGVPEEHFAMGQETIAQTETPASLPKSPSQEPSQSQTLEENPNSVQKAEGIHL